MKKYFKDYMDLCKQSNQFYKKHWLGILGVSAIGLTLMIAPVVLDSRKKVKVEEKEIIDTEGVVIDENLKD